MFVVKDVWMIDKRENQEKDNEEEEVINGYVIIIIMISWEIGVNNITSTNILQIMLRVHV